MITNSVVITYMLASGNQFCVSRSFNYGDIAVVLSLCTLLTLGTMAFLRRVVHD